LGILSLLIFAMLITPALGAQNSMPGDERSAMAVRIQPQQITLDGRLNETFWNEIPPIFDFTQKEPVEGAPPTERTSIRFAYDDNALYVGARMYHREGPSAIQAPLGRRDDGEQAEFILISLDTFLDRRTAYSFGVTAGGVRLDHFHRSDSESDVDLGFNPVWEARTHIDEDGWTAEFRIPFSQLRFNQNPDQIWGLNVHRWMPAKNEDVYWALVPRTEEGWASRFGLLRGIRDVASGARIELLPYTTSASTLYGEPDPNNPFEDSVNLEMRGGVDLKVGIGPNLTLDATINPDFGQVQADPAVVNLTATETFFNEQRPFFTEGSSLLEGPQNNYFFSRRIGAPPLVASRARGDFVDSPDFTTILGAAKLTGRLPSGLSVGVLGAVTDQESARVYDSDSDDYTRVRIEPRTLWGVGRLQQEFGPDGSTGSLMFTGVRRQLNEADPLEDFLAQDAVMGVGGVNMRFAGGMYQFEASAGFTHVRGTAEAIEIRQRHSSRYFQRPDAPHLTLDATKTSLSGYKSTVILSKLGGAHWLWNLFLDLESPGVDLNDVGRIGTADGISTRNSLTYRETEPGSLLRSYAVTAAHFAEWTYGGELERRNFSGTANLTMNNFWRVSGSTQFNTRGHDWRATRGGPSIATAQGWSSNLLLQSSAASQTRWSVFLGFDSDELGGRQESFRGEVSLVPAPRWQLLIGPSVERVVDPRQYVATLDGGPEATGGVRHLLGTVDRATFAFETRLNFTIRPDLNLDFWAQPFAASGQFRDIGELELPGSQQLRIYGTQGTSIQQLPDGAYEMVDGESTFTIPRQDFNTRSLRSTAVLRWEWKPGSTLYLVWQQDRSEFGDFDDRVRLGDALRSASSTGNNVFAIKASYWFGF